MGTLLKLFTEATVTVGLGDIITFFIVVVGTVAWFIRLESKVQYLERDQARQKEENDRAHEDRKSEGKARDEAMAAKVDSLQKTMNDVLQGLGKIEGKLESRGN